MWRIKLAVCAKFEATKTEINLPAIELKETKKNIPIAHLPMKEYARGLNKCFR